ncbi:MAG: hypothetical protein Q9165_003221 [Trypethelium subeluteriae]
MSAGTKILTRENSKNSRGNSTGIFKWVSVEFIIAKLNEHRRHVSTLSVILLTHATPTHLGAFAHCCKHFPLFTRVPIYATTPVISLGRTLLQDLYASAPLAASTVPTSALTDSVYGYSSHESQDPHILLQPPTADEIASYFSLINPLKYSQPHEPLPSPFSPPLNGLTITAFAAGHTPGGTIWHIQHGLETIVYAVDWNQARENILSGAAWLGGPGASGTDIIEQLRRPTALVCSSRGADPVVAGIGRNKRDELLLTSIRETIAKGGTVLIPSDSGARILELAYLLEHTWRSEIGGLHAATYKNAKLYLASKSCGATVRYARSMLEWMDESIIREAENAQQPEKSDSHKGKGPFDFNHVKLVERKSQANRMLSSEGPRVILASSSSLEWGFSKESLQSLASDDRNLVILTERISTGSGLGKQLWDTWFKKHGSQNLDENAQASIISTGETIVNCQEVSVEGLSGNETTLYQQWLAKQRQLQSTLQPDGGTALETSADVVDEQESESSSSSDEDDTEQQGKALNVSAALSHPRHKVGLSDAELGISVLLRRKAVHDYDVRGKKGREKVFPFVVRKRRNDDFGDLIRPEEYLRAEERDDVDGEATRNGDLKQEAALGQKRKWGETTNKPAMGGRRSSSSLNKRRRMSNQGDGGGGDRGSEGSDAAHEDASESDESDYEPAEATIEGPVKAVFTEQDLKLNLKITYIDFSGIHDKRSLQMLIPMIKPRKLILVGGEERETMALASDCRRLLGADSEESNVTVFTPAVGTTVDASVDTNAWTVKLTQGLVRKLQWQNVRGLGVVAITGSLEANESEPAIDDQNRKKIKLAANQEQGPTRQSQEPAITSTPALDVVPASMAATTRSVAQPLHVGDLRLADLRRIMQASGHSAEFRGEGTLLIDGAVAVRKTGTGKIELDGGGLFTAIPRSRSLDGTFHAVKKKIYEGLAVVASG